MNVITSGQRYIDIDAYASCIAYRELMCALGNPAKAVTTSPFNESVPQIIKSLPLRFDDYCPAVRDKFIVLDLSNPSEFDRIVDNNSISEVIDHHTGFEKFWESKKQTKSQIEKVGAIGTVIYEKIVSANKRGLLTSDLCKLLIAAIADNTLNLKADITTQRDKAAFSDLCKSGKVGKDWVRLYFEDCENSIFKDLKSAIQNDTKHLTDDYWLPKTFGQLTVYNQEKVLAQNDKINGSFSNYDDWHINIISLKDGRSYLYTTSKISQSKLEKLFNKKFSGNVLILDKFMLRKEIIAMAQNRVKTEQSK